jgi:hypothetical protein
MVSLCEAPARCALIWAQAASHKADEQGACSAHETCFHEQPRQPTMPTKASGGNDDLRKVEDVVRQAHAQPMTLQEMREKWA